MKLFVHGLTPTNGIVADLTASTGTCCHPLRRIHLLIISSLHFLIRSSCVLGASIRAARTCNRHIPALESDFALFNEVLKPMVTTPNVPTTSVGNAPFTIDDDDDVLPDTPLDIICE